MNADISTLTLQQQEDEQYECNMATFWSICLFHTLDDVKAMLATLPSLNINDLSHNIGKSVVDRNDDVGHDILKFLLEEQGLTITEDMIRSASTQGNAVSIQILLEKFPDPMALPPILRNLKHGSSYSSFPHIKKLLDSYLIPRKSVTSS